MPLFDHQKLAAAWAHLMPHVKCMQDDDGVRLYEQTGTVKRAGVELPVYRCARGSTSLENYHLHLARFIPGKKKV